MSHERAVPLWGPLVAAADFRAAVARAIARIDRRVAVVTLGVAAALSLWSVFELTFGGRPSTPTPHGYVSRTIASMVMVSCIAFATLVADELVAAGRRQWVTYALAVVIGSAGGAVMQSLASAWLNLGPPFRDDPTPPELGDLRAVFLFFEYLIWGSIIVAVYVNRRSALQAAERLNSVQVLKAVAQRRMLEARLRALQARVEPQFLFGTLARVRDLYETDPPRAAYVLEQLIAYLRAALPDLRESVSPLRQEFQLVATYLGVMTARSDQSLEVVIDVPELDPTASMPAMVLLPLVNLVLFATGPGSEPTGSLHLRIVTAHARIRVELARTDSDIRADRLGDYRQALEQRLDGLYGRDWTLAVEAATPRSARIVLDIPNEPSDRRHR